MAEVTPPEDTAPVAPPLRPVVAVYRRLATALYRRMPKGLYTRALLIIVVPIVVLQSVLAFVFMERHYQLVTGRLSEAVVREIAAVVYVLETYPQDAEFKRIEEMGVRSLDMSVTILPPDPLPPPRPKPFFDLIDRNLSREISQRIGKPFWIDTVGRSRFVEIRIQLKDKVLRVVTRRSQTYASNSHIFIVWMVCTSLVLIVIAMLFLRNQIRPIERLANAAEGFGKGRPMEDFRPSGAREVRRAAQAFIEMRRRIERQMEQRTTMLAGVSHDLRTILTRFRLQLALIEQTPETAGLKRDVDEMSHMLEDYLAFTRGDGDESAQPTDMALMLEELEESAEIAGARASSSFVGEPEVVLRRNAVKRSLGNLVSNAAKYGTTVAINGRHADGWLTIVVDDDGPGIPEEERENVFRAFYRLDAARNQDSTGSGLGLAIARDVARSHGGDIQLEDSPLGGLRARFRIPG
ncbi:ATP-binding protein [Polymorphum gilvum]|uniref:histidine kinase n=1 Tax=Polymorphum gilvum (strain LMG 25793 / CGMCC 1.9160 / SL003B-26A1) TaxID=991905 RepID=F2J0G3_POLGS|nr:ATP-binding protein [Polymorphum gilvum]ADZ69631.1 ATPase, histidine kinase-, DNA gyrase B-, and HSP90-like domain protein [Polymorphum gilvum SL003B-26A1]